MNWLILGLLPPLLAAPPAPDPAAFFEIQVVDRDTGRGVPLVELRTVHDIRRYTDSAGRVAFHEPGLMGQELFFHIRSHGYEFPQDGFGFRGKRLRVVPGGRTTLKIRRLNLAERLYRVTGAGIYADTRLLGREAPIEAPLLNARVLGSDSVVNAVYRDRIYWFWGDTNRPSYPLGNFHVPGAISALPSRGGLDPARGVNLEYFTDSDGFARPTAEMPGGGPTWINGLTVLPAEEGPERMFAAYVKIKPPLEVYQRGIAEFDDRENRFRKCRTWDLDFPLYPSGHPLRHGEGETAYIYFADPHPLVRVPARPDAFLDPQSYETYTYLRAGSRSESLEIDRDQDGRLRLGWKPDTVPLSTQLESRLVEQGQIKEDEAWLRIQDVESGKAVQLHGGSVSWNDHRQCWIMIAVQQFGDSSFLGEVWYAESPTLVGPWRRARKILTHDKYSFYNPKQHPMFDQQGGRFIYFEGTYTHTFSGNPDPTPRYNYNQVMYRLDLDHPELAALRSK